VAGFDSKAPSLVFVVELAFGFAGPFVGVTRLRAFDTMLDLVPPFVTCGLMDLVIPVLPILTILFVPAGINLDRLVNLGTIKCGGCEGRGLT